MNAEKARRKGTSPLLSASGFAVSLDWEMTATLTHAASSAFCSSANLGAGFDVFGLALDRYSDTVSARITAGKKIRIIVRGKKGRNIPLEVKRNSAGPPALELAEKARLKRGLEIIVQKNVPQGLGLGSSGASAAACTKAIDHLLGLKLPTDELVRIASLGEKAVAGTAHADNVAASIRGGFVIAFGNPIRTISVKPPQNLITVVVSPQITVAENKTRQAREIIPKKIEVNRAILNVGRASAIVAGFAKGDIEMIGTGMVDEIAEPHRERRIPGFSAARRAALEAGAAGVSISGAGPSAIAIVDRKHHDPRTVGLVMAKGFADNKIRSTWFIARPAPGAAIIEMK